MSKFEKIIFLDEENTMLGPYAEAVMKRLLAYAGMNRLKVSSKGTVVLFPEPVNQKIALIAEKKGIFLAYHRASGIKASDFSEKTLVLTMDEETKNRVYHKFTEASNVFTLKNYVEQTGSLHAPVGGSVEDFEAVCRELEALLNSLLEKEIGS